MQADQKAADRFFAVYREKQKVRPAAIAAGVHRATIYRWKERDPAFAARWEQIDEELYTALQERLDQEDAERARARAARLAELRPIYVQNAAHAREVKARRYR